MTNEPRDHHWVPRYYLRHFQIASHVKLFTYNKRTQRHGKGAPRRLFQELDFHRYDYNLGINNQDEFALEKELGREYEDRHSVLHALLIEELSKATLTLPPSFKLEFAEAVALQLLRTPRTRAIPRHLAETESSNPLVSLSPDELLKGAHLLTLGNKKGLTRLAQHLATLHWSVLSVPTPASFWTSDTPVITGQTDSRTGNMALTASQGLKLAGIEVYYPLSQNHCLVLTGRHARMADWTRIQMPADYAP